LLPNDCNDGALRRAVAHSQKPLVRIPVCFHREGVRKESLDPGLQFRDVEVNQQPVLTPGRLPVRQQWRLVNSLDLLGTFSTRV
jgi:hypothetical protein